MCVLLYIEVTILTGVVVVHTYKILVFRRLRQENCCNYKASLGYVVSILSFNCGFQGLKNSDRQAWWQAPLSMEPSTGPLQLSLLSCSIDEHARIE